MSKTGRDSYSSPLKLSPLQKAMGNPRHLKYCSSFILIRPFQRFKPATVLNSGVNPHGGFLEFVKKDPVTNIDVHRDSRPPPPDISHLSNKWAIGTKKHTFGIITADGLLDRSSIENKAFPRNPTDNISYDPPANDRPFQRVFDEMMTKPKYNINDKSANPWTPYQGELKTINNRGSVSHNIISNEPNKFSPGLAIGLLDKKVTNMKKGIGEYGDLQRLTALNPNPAYLQSFNENPDQFKRKSGVFTYLYDSAHRFGEDKPFKH